MNPPLGAVDRHLIGEIAPSAAVVMVVLVSCYGILASAEVLSDAVSGRIRADAIVQIVFLRVVVAGEFLVPTALFVACAWTYARLDRSGELTVYRASGVSVRRLLIPCAGLAIILLLVVLCLTMVVRPWAFRTIYVLEGQWMAGESVQLAPGEFYPLNDDTVVVAERVPATGPLEEVFLEERRALGTQVIRARSLDIGPAAADGTRTLRFADGFAYWLAQDTQGNREQQFAVLAYEVSARPPRDGGSRRRARPIGELDLTLPKELAEAQWRGLLPLLSAAAVIMAALLGFGAPRSAVVARLVAALVAYIAVFNVAVLARTWVESSVVGAVPGLFWTLVVPILVCWAAYSWRSR